MFSKEKELVCSHCGVIGKQRKIGMGFFSMTVAIIGVIFTIVGLFAGIIPGLIIGFMTSAHITYYQKKKGVECRYCLAKNTMIPTDTPIGNSLIEKFGRVIGG